MSPVIIILSTIGYAGIHSWLATVGVKSQARQLLGTKTDRWYRLAYNIFAGISFLPILWLLAVLPDQNLYIIPMPGVILTLLGQTIGAVIVVLGVLQTDAWHFLGVRQLFETTDQSPNQELSIRGLYSWVRHPLYFGGLIFIWLTPKMTVNLLTLFIILTIYLFVGAKWEEKRLVQEFGPAYQEYQQRVPMLIPWFRKRK